jgi:hypothetical protein
LTQNKALRAVDSGADAATEGAFPMIPPEAIAEYPDTSLLPGENPDLRDEILKTIGEGWLFSKNLWLDNRPPVELIGTDEEFRVRNMVRSFVVAALS